MTEFDWRARDSFRYEFGKVCAHFAGGLVAIVSLTLLWLFERWVVETVLIAMALWLAAIGVAVYLEMHRKEKVQGKGGREVP